MDELDNLLKRVEREPELRGALMAALMNAELYMFFQEVEVSGRITNEVTTWAGDHGNYLPVFTSQEELDRFARNEASCHDLLFSPIGGAEFFGIVADLYNQGGYQPDIVINPASDHGLYLFADDVITMQEYFHREDVVVQQPTEVMLGKPIEDPVELKRAIAKILKEERVVKAAYLTAMLDHGQSSLLVGIDLDDLKYRDNIFSRCGIAGRPHLIPQQLFDLVLIGTDDISTFLLEEGDCFYKRLEVVSL